MHIGHIQIINRLKIAKGEKEGTDAKKTHTSWRPEMPIERQRERHRKTDWQKRVHAQSNQCADYCTPVWQWTGSLNTGWTEPELRARPCVLFSAIPDALAALSSVPSLRPSPFWQQGSRLIGNPSKLRFASSALAAFPQLSGARLLACLFVLVDVWALGPLAVRFGHAGHEEYPALTWHIRSDDWDRLAARSGRGYYKKEGKRETERGSEWVRKGEEERGRGRGPVWPYMGCSDPLGNTPQKSLQSLPVFSFLVSPHPL